MFGKTLPPSEKWKAIGAFGAIAGVSAVAFDLMLFGGFQIDPTPTRAVAEAPRDNRYADMIDSGWRSAYTTIATAWADEAAIDPEAAAEDLAGDASSAPVGTRAAVYSVTSEDELYEEIAALYAEQDERAAARAEERAMAEAELVPDDYFADDAFADDKAASDNPEPVTAYENASPW